MAGTPSRTGLETPHPVTAPSEFSRWKARSAGDLAPAGNAHRLAANIEALQTLRQLERAGRVPTPAEQAVLARWSSWGSLSKLFDPTDDHFQTERELLRDLLDESEWAAAARTTINAHYTDFDVAATMWASLVRAGFDGGRVLEPGVGAGTFLATAPDHLAVEAVGIEVDPVTARIAQALHPDADIRSESFAVTRFPEGSFDLAIGNVPFGDIRLFDPVYNKAGHSIHNHFVIKSLRMVRPGGYVALLTSRFTLDAQGQAARAEIADLADLVGAFRLPNGTMHRVAGTDVAMDLLVLRRRPADDPPRGEAFLELAATGPVTVNEVFARHPDWVLGEMRAGRGQFGRDDLEVVAHEGPVAARLDAVLASVLADAGRHGLSYIPRTDVEAGDRQQVTEVRRGTHHVERSILRRPGGGFAVIRDGIPVPHIPPKPQAAELGMLIDLRDAYFDLIDDQSRAGADDRWEAARDRLEHLYDAYLAEYGPINRSKLTATGRSDADGQPVMARRYPAMGGFNTDPGLAVVRALEVFDDDTGTATKAAIFERRLLHPRATVHSAERPDEALAACLDECGRVDLDTIGRLLDCTPIEARARLGELVYDDPGDGGVLTAAEYLSGDVRSRLAAARQAATSDSRYALNVAALEAVQPRDLEPAEIEARLGASWIPPDCVADFCAEILEADVSVEYEAVTGEWVIAQRVGRSNSVTLTSEWGTSRANGIRLVDANLNQRLVTITDEAADGSRITNLAETLAAREKQEAITERFSDWLWEDRTRADRLASDYNRRFNSTVLPSYDGSHLSLPGLAAGFRPHPHQLDAVWRILSEPTVLLAHSVGAGKTATMVIAGQELKRLGLVNKPAYVVPNHMLEQFSREYLQLYPQAQLLVASRDDVSPARRKEFVARCAGGEWDAVIMTHAGFERIAVSPETEAQFLQERIASLRDAINASRTGLTVKHLEKVLARAEERHRALLADNRRDQGGVSFENTGIDYLYLDEAHAYKNLAVNSRIAGVRVDGSKRAEDMAMKLDWLRRTHGHRVATFATATPIANSIAEMYVMQRYLAPSALDAAGVDHFDGWAANFGRTVTALELAPDSSSYRMTTRFARFANVPDLLRMFRAFADVRTADQLRLAIPDIAGGRPETVVIAASEELSTYVSSLAERAEAIRNRLVRPEEDNMLKVAGDGRKAALDLRLVGGEPDPSGGKLATAADLIAEIYESGSDRAYMAEDRTRSDRRGALQLVFCDLGTPHGDDAWNVYSELRSLLVARGLPAERIRFMHEAGTDLEKARLFAAARTGGISVLIGSTEKMGVGTNVQTRAIALHHIDCPWRPADLEQREGRVLRQGNQNGEVRIIRYVTEGSFDVFSWQTVERKAGFINQITRGEVAERTVDDIGDQALSYAEVKALATGNPLIMEKAGVEAELTKLERLQAAHRQEQANLTRRAAAATCSAEEQDALALAYRTASGRAIDTSGERFQMVVGEHPYSKRVEAAAALQSSLVDVLRSSHESRCEVQVGSLAGFPVVAHATRDSLGSSVALSLDGVPRSTPATTPSELRDSPPLGLLTRLENLGGDLDSRSVAAAQRAEESRREAERASSRIGAEFEHSRRIVTLKARLVEINKELAPDDPVAPAEKADLSTVARRPVAKPVPSRGSRSLRPAVRTSPPFDPVQREEPRIGL